MDIVPVNSLYILGGDFNAKHEYWNNLNNNYKGVVNNWFQSQIDKTKQVYPFFPTYTVGKRFSIIDFFIMSSKISLRCQNNYFCEMIEFESDAVSNIKTL